MNPVRRTLKRIFGVVFINDRKDMRLMFNCFLAALLFWTVNAMQKEYSAIFTLPIQFVYDKSKFQPQSELPQRMQVELKANGWNLIQKTLGIGLDTVMISPELPRKQYVTIYDLTKWSEGGIAGASLEKIKGDSLHFQFISLRK